MKRSSLNRFGHWVLNKKNISNHFQYIQQMKRSIQGKVRHIPQSKRCCACRKRKSSLDMLLLGNQFVCGSFSCLRRWFLSDSTLQPKNQVCIACIRNLFLRHTSVPKVLIELIQVYAPFDFLLVYRRPAVPSSNEKGLCSIQTIKIEEAINREHKHKTRC